VESGLFDPLLLPGFMESRSLAPIGLYSGLSVGSRDDFRG
jgi:hypothetical protein